MPDLSRLDDKDYPTYTTGQAARMLGIQEAFLRSLDAADVVSPQRSEGGHRRYTRRQLAQVVRLREQLDAGHTVAAAARIVGLQDQLADTQHELASAEDEIVALRDRLRDATGEPESENLNGREQET